MNVISGAAQRLNIKSRRERDKNDTETNIGLGFEPGFAKATVFRLIITTNCCGRKMVFAPFAENRK